MENNSEMDLQAEILISGTENKRAQVITRAAKAGKLRKIAPKIYTSNLVDEPADIVLRHRYFILGQLYPGAVISHRSALEGGFAEDNSIVLTYKYTKNIKLPGMLIRLFQGHGALENDTSFLGKLSISSRARALLENLQPSRSRTSLTKTLSVQEVELRLDKIIRIYGEEEINILRDEAKIISAKLEMQKKFKTFDKIIEALLGTKKASELSTGQGRARAGIPDQG